MSSSAMQGGHKYWNNRIGNCAALRVRYETTNTLRLVRRRRVLALRPLSLSLSLCTNAYIGQCRFDFADTATRAATGGGARIIGE